MPVKVTYMFNLGAQGWSTTFYNSQISALPSNQITPPQVQALGNAIFNTLAPGVNYIGIRVSLTPPTRQTYVSVGNTVRTGSSDQTPDYLTTAMMIICKGAQGLGTRQLWLHGINDNEINYSNGVFAVGGGLLGAAQAVQNLLTGGNGWCLRTVAPRTGQTFPILGVAPSVVQAGTALTTAGGFVVPVSGSVIVGGFRFPLQHLNGTYTVPVGVISAAAGTLLVGKYVSAAQASAYPGNATIRYQVPNYNTAITSANFEFVRERRVGRAFFVPRGRRSSK